MHIYEKLTKILHNVIFCSTGVMKTKHLKKKSSKVVVLNINSSV